MPGMNPMSVLVTVLTGVVVVGGCRDSPTEPAQPLNEEEARVLFTGLMEVVADSTAEPISNTSDGIVFACARGGELAVTIEGSQEEVGDTARTNVDMGLDPAGCVIWSAGYQFTLDGNPGVRMEMTLSSVGPSGLFGIDMTATGGVDWQLDDRSGTCMLDLSGSTRLDSANGTAEGGLAGTLCGLEVEFDSLQPPVQGGPSVAKVGPDPVDIR